MKKRFLKQLKFSNGFYLKFLRLGGGGYPRPPTPREFYVLFFATGARRGSRVVSKIFAKAESGNPLYIILYELAFVRNHGGAWAQPRWALRGRRDELIGKTRIFGHLFAEKNRGKMSFG